MNIPLLLGILALVFAALSYWRPVFLGVAVILLAIAAVLGLAGCATDPATGRRVYAGPPIALDVGFLGVRAGVTVLPTATPVPTPEPAAIAATAP